MTLRSEYFQWSPALQEATEKIAQASPDTLDHDLAKQVHEVFEHPLVQQTLAIYGEYLAIPGGPDGKNILIL